MFSRVLEPAVEDEAVQAEVDDLSEVVRRDSFSWNWRGSSSSEKPPYTVKGNVVYLK